MKRNPLFSRLARYCVARIGLLLLLSCLYGLTAYAQVDFFTYGKAALNDGGAVIVPPASATADTFFVGGYTEDSTFIMVVNTSGVILNQITFKLSPSGYADMLMDLRLDSDDNLVGCGYYTGAGQENFNGFYFKIPTDLSAFIWQHQVQYPGGNVIHQPFTIHEVAGSSPQEFLLSGKMMPDNTTATGDPWIARVNGADGDITTSFFWLLNTGVISVDQYSNMLEDGSDLLVIGDVNFAAAPGSLRPSMTSLNTAALTPGSTGAKSYIWPVAGIDAHIYATDFIGNSSIYHTTGTGNFDPNLPANTEFFLVRTIGGTYLDLAAPLHWKYDLLETYRERSEEVLEYGGDIVMLLEGEPGPTGEINIYLCAVNATGVVQWVRMFGETGVAEHLVTGSQSQMAIIAGDLFFTGIRNDGTEDILLVKVESPNPALEGCVEEATVERDSTPDTLNIPWKEQGDNLDSFPAPPDVLPWIFNDEIICSSCPMATDPQYLVIYDISGVVTISANTIWPDKVYIAPNMTVSVVGATLDITQADIVFDDCARIEVGAGGHIRANNSTFRPCDELRAWPGIYFLESTVTGQQNASGFFNDCLFKNMLDGIYINPNPSTALTGFNVRLTNNTFVDCYFGVRTNSTIMSDPITGNTFMTEVRDIEYVYTDCPTTPPYNPTAPMHFGIEGINTLFEGSISQNDFINTLDRTNAVSFVGIDLFSCIEANITLNNFTNMYRSVEMTSCISMAVENNEVEVTHQYDQNENQIWCDDGELIWIDGNHLIKTLEDYTTALVVGAIYIEDSWLYNIKENTIDGFIAGIQCIRTLDSSQVIENKISNCNLVGIWVEEGEFLDVSCNTIKMRRRDPATTIGIRYACAAMVPPNGMRFRGNCIFNASNSMVMIDGSLTCPALPLIRNNYLYNYTNAGILCTNFTGFIGAPGFPAHNTFTSNNAPFPFVPDVLNTTPAACAAIAVDGNWGIFNISPGVALGPANNIFHSMADCGLQIDNQAMQQWTIRDQCDRFRDNITVFIPNIVAGNHDVFEARNGQPGHPGYAHIALFRIYQLHGKAIAQPYYEHLLSGALLNARQKLDLRYDWYLRTAQWDAAMEVLQQLRSLPKGSHRLFELEELRLMLLSQGRSLKDATPGELQQLESMAASDHANADMARAYLHHLRGSLPYIHEPIVMPEMPSATPSLSNATDRDHMEAFPNPSNDKVSVKFHLNAEVRPIVRISDLMGRILQEQEVEFSAGTVTLDIAAYRQGSYIISVVGQNGHSLFGNLIKL
jgi:hypothetical protein